MNTLRESWSSYRRQVVPADAGHVQIEECRRAFFAGAAALVAALFGAVSDGPEVTTADMDAIRAIGRELLAEAERVRAMGDIP